MDSERLPLAVGRPAQMGARACEAPSQRGRRHEGEAGTRMGEKDRTRTDGNAGSGWESSVGQARERAPGGPSHASEWAGSWAKLNGLDEKKTSEILPLYY
jgi:hypothetical protein